MQDFQRLRVWQSAHEYRLRVYGVARRFPRGEERVLVPQLRRSASSICWNIAEGAGRGSDRDFARCLQIAIGSGLESLDQLIQARDLGYIQPADFEELAAINRETCRQLTRLIQRLRNGKH